MHFIFRVLAPEAGFRGSRMVQSLSCPLKSLQPVEPETLMYPLPSAHRRAAAAAPARAAGARLRGEPAHARARRRARRVPPSARRGRPRRARFRRGGYPGHLRQRCRLFPKLVSPISSMVSQACLMEVAERQTFMAAHLQAVAAASWCRPLCPYLGRASPGSLARLARLLDNLHASACSRGGCCRCADGGTRGGGRECRPQPPRRVPGGRADRGQALAHPAAAERQSGGAHGRAPGLARHDARAPALNPNLGCGIPRHTVACR